VSVLQDIKLMILVGVYQAVMLVDVNYVFQVTQVNVKIVALEHSLILSEIVLHVIKMEIVMFVVAPLYVRLVEPIDT